MSPALPANGLAQAPCHVWHWPHLCRSIRQSRRNQHHAKATAAFRKGTRSLFDVFDPPRCRSRGNKIRGGAVVGLHLGGGGMATQVGSMPHWVFRGSGQAEAIGPKHIVHAWARVVESCSPGAFSNKLSRRWGWHAARRRPGVPGQTGPPHTRAECHRMSDLAAACPADKVREAHRLRDRPRGGQAYLQPKKKKRPTEHSGSNDRRKSTTNPSSQGGTAAPKLEADGRPHGPPLSSGLFARALHNYSTEAGQTTWPNGPPPWLAEVCAVGRAPRTWYTTQLLGHCTGAGKT